MEEEIIKKKKKNEEVKQEEVKQEEVKTEEVKEETKTETKVEPQENKENKEEVKEENSEVKEQNSEAKEEKKEEPKETNENSGADASQSAPEEQVAMANPEPISEEEINDKKKAFEKKKNKEYDLSTVSNTELLSVYALLLEHREYLDIEKKKVEEEDQ